MAKAVSCRAPAYSWCTAETHARRIAEQGSAYWPRKVAPYLRGLGAAEKTEILRSVLALPRSVPRTEVVTSLVDDVRHWSDRHEIYAFSVVLLAATPLEGSWGNLYCEVLEDPNLIARCEGISKDLLSTTLSRVVQRHPHSETLQQHAWGLMPFEAARVVRRHLKPSAP
jgi:hypothetical protein